MVNSTMEWHRCLIEEIFRILWSFTHYHDPGHRTFKTSQSSTLNSSEGLFIHNEQSAIYKRIAELSCQK